MLNVCKIETKCPCGVLAINKNCQNCDIFKIIKKCSFHISSFENLIQNFNNISYLKQKSKFTEISNSFFL